MNNNFNYFPRQRVSGEEKNKPEWYENCIDYVIATAINVNDKDKMQKKLDMLHGNIPDEYYAKTINPYNAKNEKYTRFPATMRNLDIINDIVRRYISEYVNAVHEFIVTVSNSEITLKRETDLRNAIQKKAEEVFAAQFQAKYQEQINQGADPTQIDTTSLMPDIETFIKEFDENYIDEQSIQAQNLLDFIDDSTESDIIYPKAWFDFVTLGECYSYRDIRHGRFVKDVVPAIEAYPVPNSNQFSEDYEMFARKQKMSYQEIIDEYDDFLSETDKEFLYNYFGNINSLGNSNRTFSLEDYNKYFSPSAGKFSTSERDLFSKQPTQITDVNTNLIDVWHVVWRGEAKHGVLTYQNEVGFIDTIVVDETFKFNKSLGHISLEWHYEPQVYEGVRIGVRTCGLYPIKSRPICYNRNGKLPYNGIKEILPDMGQFSIVEIVTPFQILRNIFSYHREMIIAKNKMSILLAPKSLLSPDNNDDAEDIIYKMAADGVLAFDDSEDVNNQKAANIRMLNASMTSYITEMTGLIDSMKQEARESVDMSQQRYGDIAQSAGATTTKEAITRSSMGSVIITFMFDKFRTRDYQADIDYTKLAYIDGLDTSYRDKESNIKYLSLDINSHINSQYGVSVKNSAVESQKLNQYKDWAFSAAQNGDLEMASAAIGSNNTTAIKAAINKYAEIKRKHEEDLRNLDAQLENSKIENKLKEIAAKGEQDRLSAEAQYLLDMKLKYVDVDLSILTDNDSSSSEINNAKLSIEQSKREIEKEKLNADTYNKAADRNVKREQIAASERIAKENKNRYDK